MKPMVQAIQITVLCRERDADVVRDSLTEWYSLHDIPMGYDTLEAVRLGAPFVDDSPEHLEALYPEVLGDPGEPV